MEIPPLDYRLQNGRPEDPHFDDSENIYYRLIREKSAPPKIVDPNEIDMPDFSVDRGKYTEKVADVVHLYPKQSVLRT